MDADFLLQQARDALDRGELTAVEDTCSQVLISHPASVQAHQLLARVYLAQENREKVEEILGRREGLPVDEHFVQWGMIAEEADDLELAAEIYSGCLRSQPQNPLALYRLGMLHLERGERSRAIELLGDAVKVQPDFTQALLELAQCYAEDEWWGLAAHAYRRLVDLEPGHPEGLAGLRLVETRMRELADLSAPEPAQDEGMAGDLLALFSGRESVHARQWIDPDGKVGYGPVHEPLSERLLRMHVRGEVTLGAYVVRNDNTVLFAAIDIDVRKAVLARCQANGRMSSDLAELVRADALRVEKFCEHLHLPVYAEDSGYKGMHLWFFFGEPIPADQVKRFLEAVVQRAGPPSPELQWEIFPKQERVEPGHLGNLIKIPLGVHRRTGRRCLFTDGNGQAYADQGALLRGVRRVDRATFEQAVARLAQPGYAAGVALSAGDALEGFPDFEPLFAGCAVLKALAEKARVTHHLAHEERMVLKCVLAHMGEPGQKLIHALVGHCLDYAPQVTQQQIERTPPHPISCPKIRQRLPEITSGVNCACQFALPDGGYPSPLLHLDGEFTRGRSQAAGKNGVLVERYVQLRREVQKLRQELLSVEDDLHYALQLRGGDSLKANGWVLRRDEQNRLLVEMDVD